MAHYFLFCTIINNVENTEPCYMSYLLFSRCVMLSAFIFSLVYQILKHSDMLSEVGLLENDRFFI